MVKAVVVRTTPGVGAVGAVLLVLVVVITVVGRILVGATGVGAALVAIFAAAAGGAQPVDVATI